MSCSVCYERGYYTLTTEDDYEVVLCECQLTKERESNDR
jgi:hypothetical protein